MSYWPASLEEVEAFALGLAYLRKHHLAQAIWHG